MEKSKNQLASLLLIFCGIVCFPAAGFAMYANFVSQSVPSKMDAGKTYSVSITMKNPSIAGWGQPGWEQALYWSEAKKCRLGSQNPQDNKTWGVNRVYLSSSEIIKFNTNKTFTFNVTAPLVAGVYNFQWRMVQDGVAWFGDKTPNLSINVVNSCVPKTCASLGYACGTISDGCGNALNCGNCATGYSCSSNQCVANCVPKTCASLNYNCGTASNGCGGTLNCGSCASGQICSSGQCVAQCVNECSSAGIKQCSGNGFQTCGNYDSDSCLEWSQITLCPDEKACSSGICLTGSLKHCNGNGYQFCKNYENDACVEWSTIIACPSGQTCSNGICFACVPMAVSGCKVCNLLGTGWADDNSKCLTGEACSNGVCIVSDSNISVSDNNNINGNNNTDTTNNIGVNLPTVDITADGYQKKALINAGEPVTLLWNSTNADICQASGSWSGNKTKSGAMRITIGSPKEYIITCSNSAGSATDSVAVEIVSQQTKGAPQTANSNIANIGEFADNAGITREQLINKINQIKNLIESLTRQLQILTGEGSEFSCGMITENLFYGIRGNTQVKCLQEVLKSQDLAVVPTGDFGGITKTAVIQFQEKYAGEILSPIGLSHGSGYVGRLTREKINKIISGE